MRKMNREELEEILAKHQKWLNGESGGERANLKYANLEGADLRGAVLECANLEGANLEGANLEGANLEGAYLRGAYLKYANLRDANLRGANLEGASLRGTDLEGATLRGTDLRGTALIGTRLPQTKAGTICRMDFGSWSICIRHDNTSIGCKTCYNEEWLKYTPDDVKDFDSKAEAWWELHGDAIKAVIKCVMKKAESLPEE